MPDFSYKARVNGGALVDGSIAAPSAEQAAAMLRADGKFVVDITAAATKKAASTIRIGGKPMKPKEVITFCHQLGVMLDTGVPISEALDIAVDQAETPTAKTIIQSIASQVQGGGDLSTALAQHPKVFPNIMISLVRAGEASGKMGQMLDRVSQHLQKQAANTRRIKGALTYPAVMLAFVVVITVFLLVFVLPRFSGIFESRGAALPTPTLLLMGISDTLIHYWYGWIAAVAAIIGGYFLLKSREKGQAFIDAVALRIPVIGPLLKMVNLVRTMQTIGTLIEAGVPILDQIDIVKHVTPNQQYKQLWAHVDDQLRRGGQLSDGLDNTSLIPRAIVHMIRSGEKSGRMGPVITRVGEYAEEEFDTAVQNATQYIEPVMVVTVGGIVGFVAISLLLPIFSASTLASGS
ncbi:MAG: type II secretion system F family protein [Planctomycetota bacterium]